MLFIIYEGIQEKNSSMMSIKIQSLLEHYLWSIKEFNGDERNDESFLWMNKKKKEGERIFFRSMAAQ